MRVRPAALGMIAAAGSLLGAAVLSGGGSTDGSLPWIGAGALLVVVLLGTGGLVGLWPMPKLSSEGAAAVAFLTLLVAWTGLSILWSFAPDLSWGYLNRGITYLTLLAVGIFLGALVRRAPTVLAALIALAVAAALVWALAGKIDPSLFEDGARRARLRDPVGIWNLLAGLLAFGVPLTLWLAGRRFPVLVRALAVGFLFLLVPALALTLSRSGILAAILAGLLWLALARDRLDTLVALAISVPAGIGLAGWALDRPGLVDEGQSFAQRAADGRQFGIYLALGFAAAVIIAGTLALLERAWPPTAERRRQLTLAAVGVAVLVVVLLAIAFVVRVGDPAGWIDTKLEELTSEELVTNEASRLSSVSLNNRLDWWEEAIDAFRGEPVLEPHNLPLQFLAETGVIGGVLLVAAALFALLAAGRAVRRLDEADRLAGLALFVILVVYLAHSVVEVDWDFIAVSAPAFLGLGVLLGSGPSQTLEYRRAGWVVPTLAVALLAAASLVVPAVAERQVTRS